LTADIIALAIQYGRYGYRRITKMLCTAGWTVSFKRVERIWRREGLKGDWSPASCSHEWPFGK
jgi:putative transposase